MFHMKQNKPTLILLEGHIGSGKSTTSTLIREKFPTYTLIRPTGLPKETDGQVKNYIYHSNILMSVEDNGFLQMNYVLDRTFISNLIYARLGLKDYTFEAESETLSAALRRISYRYNVYLINLYCSDDDELTERLGGRNKFQYVEHTLNQAKNQRKAYHEYFGEIKDVNYMTVKELDTYGKTVDEILEEIKVLVGGK